MKLRFQFLIFSFFLVAGFAAGFSASAVSGTCPTDNGAGVGCNVGIGEYYCLGSCRTGQTQCADWTGTICADGLTCPANCDSSDSCGYCNSCIAGYTLCGSYPNQTCTANTTPPSNCTSYNQCTAACSACAQGYVLTGGVCVAATLKLGSDSVGAANHIFQSTNPFLYVLSSGNVGIGTSAPSDIFSIGNSGAAPAGSPSTGHNYTSTYLSADNYALVNYGLLKTITDPIIPGGASSLWNGTSTGNIWNMNSGNVGIGTTTPLAKLEIAGGDLIVGNRLGGSQSNVIKFNRAATTDSLNFLFTDANNSKVGVGLRGNTDGLSFSIGSLTAGNTKMYLDTSGNLGIGTTAPTAPLEIKNNATSSYVSTLKLSALGAITGQDFSMTNSYGRTLRIRQYNSNSTGPLSGSAFFQESGGSLLFITNTANPIYFATNNRYVTPDMTLDSSGNLGIGTTAPNDIFSIGNSGAAPAGSPNTGHNYTSSYLSNDDYALTNVGYVKSALITAGGGLWATSTSGIYNVGLGNVGIGTNAPGFPLTVVTTGLTAFGSSYFSSATANPYTAYGFNLSNTNTTNGNYVSFWMGDNLYGAGLVIASKIINHSTKEQDFEIHTKNSAGTIGQRFTISSDGNVGIGTSTPTNKLEVASGNISVGFSNTGNGQQSSLKIYSFDNSAQQLGTLAADYADSMRSIHLSGNANTSQIKIDSSANANANIILMPGASGKVGVGTSTPGAPLHVYSASPTGISVQRTSVANSNISYINPSFIRYAGLSSNGAWAVGAVQDLDSSPYFYINSTGNIGIGTSAPNDIFSIGNSGAAPTGSPNTGHNFTNTYLATDDYALTNYGLVKTLIGSATSTISSSAVYATSTPASYNGSQGGYTGVNALCSAVVSGSHVCTTGEILYTINKGSGSTIPANSALWISNGPPAYTANANDCMGWTSAVNSNYGTLWNRGVSGDGFGSLEICNISRKYACCK